MSNIDIYKAKFLKRRDIILDHYQKNDKIIKDASEVFLIPYGNTHYRLLGDELNQLNNYRGVTDYQINDIENNTVFSQKILDNYSNIIDDIDNFLLIDILKHHKKELELYKETLIRISQMTSSSEKLIEIENKITDIEYDLRINNSFRNDKNQEKRIDFNLRYIEKLINDTNKTSKKSTLQIHGLTI